MQPGRIILTQGYPDFAITPSCSELSGDRAISTSRNGTGYPSEVSDFIVLLDLTLLTCGNPTLSYEQNEIILKHVFEYIKRSKRFLVV